MLTGLVVHCRSDTQSPCGTPVHDAVIHWPPTSPWFLSSESLTNDTAARAGAIVTASTSAQTNASAVAFRDLVRAVLMRGVRAKGPLPVVRWSSVLRRGSDGPGRYRGGDGQAATAAATAALRRARAAGPRFGARTTRRARTWTA